MTQNTANSQLHHRPVLRVHVQAMQLLKVVSVVLLYTDLSLAEREKIKVFFKVNAWCLFVSVKLRQALQSLWEANLAQYRAHTQNAKEDWDATASDSGIEDWHHPMCLPRQLIGHTASSWQSQNGFPGPLCTQWCQPLGLVLLSLPSWCHSAKWVLHIQPSCYLRCLLQCGLRGFRWS